MHWFIRTIPESDLTDAIRDAVLELVSRTGMPVETIVANLLDALAPWEGLRTELSQRAWEKHRGSEEVLHKASKVAMYVGTRSCPSCHQPVTVRAIQEPRGIEMDLTLPGQAFPSKQSASKG